MTGIHWVVATIIVRANVNDQLFEYDDLMGSFSSLPNVNIKYLLLEYYQDTKTVYTKQFNHALNVFDIKSQGPAKGFYAGLDIVGFLKDHVLQSDPACKYMLITWGHGAGLGFFTREIKKEALTGFQFSERKKDKVIEAFKQINKFSTLYNLLQANNIIKQDKKPNIKELFLNKFTEQEDLSLYEWLEGQRYIPKYDLISSETFGNILSTCFKERKIDIMLTINCYMQTFETGFGLQRNVDYLIASQTGFLFAGIHYAELFKFLNTSQSETDINTLQVIENIKQYYPVKYQEFEEAGNSCYSSKKNPNFDLNLYQIAASKLSIYANELKTIINKIVSFFFTGTQLQESHLRTIKQARPYCLDMAPNANYGIIDFLLFLQLYIQYNSSDSFIKNQTDQIIQLQTPDNFINIFRSNQLDEGIQLDEDFQPLYYKKPQYFSVFFPNNNDDANTFIQDFINEIYREGSTSAAVYIKEVKWDDFIRSFYATL